MGWRLRRRLRLLPGLAVNIGLPGTGLSYTSYRRREPPQPQAPRSRLPLLLILAAAAVLALIGVLSHG